MSDKDKADEGGTGDAREGAQPLSSPSQSAPTADMQAFIGRQLRAVYDDIAQQPVPDRFVELMKLLEG